MARSARSVIELPWPHPALSPNSRGHWGKKQRATKIAREYAFWAVKEAKIGIAAGDVPILISMTFHPKTANLPDADNCVASMKASLDGIAQALGMDDRDFRIAEPVIAAPVKGGKVLVTIG